MADDGSFGPVLGASFDFTLTFENWFLTILPAALLILATPIYARVYLRRPVTCLSGPLLWCKLAAGAALVAVEIIAGILWGVSLDFPTPSAPVAVTLSCLAAACVVVMVGLGHRYATQSSMLFSVYLSIAFVLEMARTRSFFLRAGLAAVGALTSVGTVLRLVLLILEEFPKPLAASPSEKPENAVSQEALGGFWNRTMLFWLNPTLLRGFRQHLEMENLASLGSDFAAENLSNRFEPIWARADKSLKYCLASATVKTLMLEFIAPAIPRLAQASFNFSLPWLMRRVLSFVQDSEHRTAANGGGLVGAAVFIYFGMALSRTSFKHLNNRFAVQLRGLLVARVLIKNLGLRYSAAQGSVALTIMGTDIEGVIDSIQGFHDIWVGMLEIAAALYLLSLVIGVAFFLPVTTILISFGCSYVLGMRLIPASAAWNESIQTRVSSMATILSQMKAIKMTGLDDKVRDYMRALRQEEIDKSTATRWIKVRMTFLLPLDWAFTPALIFIGAIFWTTLKKGLDSISVFTILVLIALFGTPMITILQSWPLLGTAAACFTRVQDFLLLEERADSRSLHEPGDDSSSDTASCEKSITLYSKTSGSKRGKVVTIQGATIAATQAGEPILQDANLSISESDLVMVVGIVGSGKSILLRSLLGETFLLKGSIDMDSSAIAFCDQRTWLPNLTVQEIIVGEGKFDEAWYNTVISACMLKYDIEQFPQKDQSKIGSDGALLSGGQKQRLAIARSIFSRKRILVLDDVFSALDRTTARAIFANLFGSDGLIKKEPAVTTILATHSIEFLGAADDVIIVDNKTVVAETADDAIKRANTHDIGVRALDTSSETKVEDSEVPPIMLATDDSEAERERMLQERPRRGEFQLYRFFLQAVPKWMLVLFVIAVASAAFLERGPEFYMRSWVEVAPVNRLYFIGLIALGVVGMMVNGFVSWLWLVNAIPLVAWSLHDLFLGGVLDSTLTYLTSTNNGVILNRSSQDMSLLSQQLPMAFYQTVYITFFSVADTAMIVASATYSALVVPFMLFVIYFLQIFYLRTSRQMRYLDLEAKTPLYTKLSETASGVEHIRAFGWERQTLKESFRLLDESQKAVFYMYTIQRWLLFVLDSTILIIAVVLVTIAVFWTTTTSQPSLGLGLLGTMTWNLVLANWVNYWTTLETSLGAAQRLRTFIQTTPQEEDKPGLTKVADWPRSGQITFRNVTAKYDPKAQPKALDSVSFNILPGQSVGITGRTGSGKSSLFLAALRLIDYEGSISIDGIEVSNVPRQQLRQSLITITQDSLHLPGSVRENLLPQTLEYKKSQTSTTATEHDEEINAILAKVELLDHITSRGGLNKPFNEMNFSQGQRQLFSLARALLQKSITGSRILLIDEATSNIDYESDTRIQKILKEAFVDCTRLIIAHREQTIQDSDILMEFAGGKLISFKNRTIQK